MGSSGPPPRDVDRMVSLKVDNISYRTTSDELLRYFEKYGRVGDIYIPRDPRSRESRGFAFVRFNNRHDAEVCFFSFRLQSRLIYLFLGRNG